MKTMKKALLPALVALILAGPVSAEYATPSDVTPQEVATSVTLAAPVNVALAAPDANADTIGTAVGDAITNAASQGDNVLSLTTSNAVGTVLDSNPSEATVTATATNAVNAVVNNPENLKTTVESMMQTAAGKAKPQDVYLLSKGTLTASSGSASVKSVVEAIYNSFSGDQGKQEQALRGIVDGFGGFEGSAEEVAALKEKILGGIPAGKRAAMAKRLDASRK